MKNLILTLFALVGFSISGLAQDTVRVNVNGSEIIILSDDLTQLGDIDINGMMSNFSQGMAEASAEFSEKMADIKARQEAGEITEEQAEEEAEVAEEEFEAKVEALGDLMEKWAEDYDDRADAQEEQWDNWAKQWERGAEEMEENRDRTEIRNGNQTIIIDEDGVRIQDRVKEDIIVDENQGYKQDEGIIGFHFGWNTLYNSNMELANGDAAVDFFDSWTYDLEFGHKVRLGSTSPVFFQYGLNFSWHNFETKESLVKYDNGGEPAVSFEPRTDVTINETEFDIVYMDIPVMFSLDFSGKGIGNGFNLGVGGYGGVRLSSERETVYRDFNGDKIEENIDDHFLSNQWRYGLMGQIGWGSFRVTAKYDLNNLFQERYDTPDYQAASLTLGFVF
ncbi:MAG: outer membrane beta-barrel protein [Flavobacteriia bacterium]|nr:outer membrane beta-barrel protein [Flavobacteriia bacterium]